MTIRVLVADDQAMVRTGFGMIIDAQPDMALVGEAADGVAAVELARRLRPDVLLLDIRMPRLDGLAVLRQLAGHGVADPMKVVVVTTFDLDEYVHTALRNGACGFLLKDSGPALLVEAVRAAVAGDALISPSITVRLLRQLASAPPTAPTAPPASMAAAAPMASATDAVPVVPVGGGGAGAPGGVPRSGASGPGPAGGCLSPRELEVVRLVARGRTNAEIAAELYISVGTVKTHLSNAQAKLDARNRVEIAAWAWGHRLVD